MTSTLIITTTMNGKAQLTGSKDLVGLATESGEILMTSSEFEQLAKRYATWKAMGTGHVNDPCPECRGGTIRVLWSGTACDMCTYTSCY